MKSLWPDDIDQVEQKSPAAILKEQASLLGQRTKNLVVADVRAEEPPGYLDTYFQYSFSIVAPTLSGYRYRLFSIRYSVALYPLSIIDIDDEVRKEVFPKTSFSEDVSVGSESEFLETIGMILRANRTKQVISTLRKEIGS
jgi:hypothetical protein